VTLGKTMIIVTEKGNQCDEYVINETQIIQNLM